MPFLFIVALTDTLVSQRTCFLSVDQTLNIDARTAVSGEVATVCRTIMDDRDNAAERKRLRAIDQAALIAAVTSTRAIVFGNGAPLLIERSAAANAYEFYSSLLQIATKVAPTVSHVLDCATLEALTGRTTFIVGNHPPQTRFVQSLPANVLQAGCTLINIGTDVSVAESRAYPLVSTDVMYVSGPRALELLLEPEKRN